MRKLFAFTAVELSRSPLWKPGAAGSGAALEAAPLGPKAPILQIEKRVVLVQVY
jgi:hypothetical protein